MFIFFKINNIFNFLNLDIWDLKGMSRDHPFNSYSLVVGRTTVVDSSVYWHVHICYAAWENGWVEATSAAVPAFGWVRNWPWARRIPWGYLRESISIMLGSVLLWGHPHPPGHRSTRSHHGYRRHRWSPGDAGRVDGGTGWPGLAGEGGRRCGDADPDLGWRDADRERGIPARSKRSLSYPLPLRDPHAVRGWI